MPKERASMNRTITLDDSEIRVLLGFEPLKSESELV